MKSLVFEAWVIVYIVDVPTSTHVSHKIEIMGNMVSPL